EQADLVGFDLIFAFVIVAPAKGGGFTRGVFEQTVVLLEDVATIRHLRHAQRFLELARDGDGLLPRHQVTDLVRDHGGQLIFVLRKSHQLARDIDAATRQHERVGVPQVHQEELESQFGRRQVFDDAFADAPQVARDLFVVNHPEIALKLFRDGVAQINLLLFSEDVRLARGLWRRRTTRLLGGDNHAGLTRHQEQKAEFKQNFLHSLKRISKLRVVGIAVRECFGGLLYQDYVKSWAVGRFQSGAIIRKGTESG